MSQTPKNIAQTVFLLIKPTVNELGCELWDVEFVKEGSRKILRVTIDKDDGISIDDCEAVHRAIDPVLDSADPIAEAYYLEVSSPGIEKEIRREEHIMSVIGQKLEIKLYVPLDGKKKFVATLDAYDPETDTLVLDGQSIERKKIAKMNVYYEF